MSIVKKRFLILSLFMALPFAFAPHRPQASPALESVRNFKNLLLNSLRGPGGAALIEEIFTLDPEISGKIAQELLKNGGVLIKSLADAIHRDPTITQNLSRELQRVSREFGNITGEVSGTATTGFVGALMTKINNMVFDNPFRVGTRDNPNVSGMGLKFYGLALGSVALFGATVVFAKKAAEALGEKFKRWMFFPKILESLQPFEKEFTLNKLEGTVEFKKELSDLIANVLVAAKNNEYVAPIAFCGEPGVGKTLMAKILGAELQRQGYRFVKFNVSSIRNCAKPEDEIRIIFEKAANKKWILFIDEADQLIFQHRSGAVATKDPETKRLIQKVMDMTGGKNSDKFEGLIITSTNTLAEADPAMLQRFASKVIVFPKPDVETTKKFVQLYIKELLQGKRKIDSGCLNDAHLNELSQKILVNKFSGRLIEGFVLAIRTGSGVSGSVNKAFVDKCLDYAIASAKERGNYADPSYAAATA